MTAIQGRQRGIPAGWDVLGAFETERGCGDGSVAMRIRFFLTFQAFLGVYRVVRVQGPSRPRSKGSGEAAHQGIHVLRACAGRGHIRTALWTARGCRAYIFLRPELQFLAMSVFFQFGSK